MSRVNLIRDVIVKAGGAEYFKYYCDGPRSGFGPTRGRGARKGRSGDTRVSYKIEGRTDGLKTREQRMKVAEELSKLPGVEVAYVTRVAKTVWGMTNLEGNIKVIFSDRV